MINYETILSSYDDKLTLLQWLKKVEAALADASATSFSVTKTGNATIKFVLSFADGSTLESPEIVLQQGESVASAAIDANGHLLLTLTNGDVLDAGSMFDGNVSITGTLSVAGNSSLGGDLDVSGNSEFHDAAQFDSDVNIDGDVYTGDLTPSNLLIPSTGSIKPASAGQTQIDSDVGIVEKMQGYSFTKPTHSAVDLNIQYASAVKNGNKVTFVISGTIKRTGTIYTAKLGEFAIPSAIGSQLIPTETTILRYLSAYCAIDQQNGSAMPVFVQKNSDTSISFWLDKANTLTQDETYFFSVEVTFLLSANMAA